MRLLTSRSGARASLGAFLRRWIGKALIFRFAQGFGVGDGTYRVQNVALGQQICWSFEQHALLARSMSHVSIATFNSCYDDARQSSSLSTRCHAVLVNKCFDAVEIPTRRACLSHRSLSIHPHRWFLYLLSCSFFCRPSECPMPGELPFVAPLNSFETVMSPSPSTQRPDLPRSTLWPIRKETTAEPAVVYNHISKHQWSSGRIHRCHRCDPGSIPG